VIAPVCSICGGSSFSIACVVCGAEMVVDEAGVLSHRVARAGDQSMSDREQTASDHDQTESDDDQTRSDRDQSASDHDQKSSDRDQHAADDDLAAGSDRGVYERTSRARRNATGDRDDAARQRWRLSRQRDRAADSRDRGADERDVVARSRDHVDEPDASRDGILSRAENDRTRATLDRERAAADRAQAADDRAQAAADRAVSARERSESMRVRLAASTLIKQASTDELTGARTRFFGLDEAGRELARAQRTGASLSFAFVDVDQLKQLNDERGHLAGDALLALVGATIRENLRTYDVIVRYGGDEFVCVLPNLELADATVRFECIAAQLSAVDHEHSITFGLAAAAPDDSLQSLIARADSVLLASRTRARTT
jgi:diguanylate cyclase (GGDEF)-like protein